jgi:hypothetical protein
LSSVQNYPARNAIRAGWCSFLEQIHYS